MKFKKQNLVDLKQGIILHGVNCKGVMGAGLAKTLKDKWNVVYSVYRANGIGNALLGSVHTIQVEPGLYVLNGYTQLDYGRGPGVRYADVDAVKRVLETSTVFAEHMKIPNIHIPILGCGLGGLDWLRDVEPLVVEVEKNCDTEFFVCHK